MERYSSKLFPVNSTPAQTWKYQYRVVVQPRTIPAVTDKQKTYSTCFPKNNTLYRICVLDPHCSSCSVVGKATDASRLRNGSTPGGRRSGFLRWKGRYSYVTPVILYITLLGRRIKAWRYWKNAEFKIGICARSAFLYIETIVLALSLWQYRIAFLIVGIKDDFRSRQQFQLFLHVLLPV